MSVPGAPDVLALVAVLALAGVLSRAWRARQGRLVRRAGCVEGGALRRVGVPVGRAALLTFTAPGCRSCAAAGAVLERVASGYPDVVLARADVGEHLDLARAQRVFRAPTTLLVDGDGQVRHRVHGVPDASALRAAVEEVRLARTPEAFPGPGRGER